MSARIKIQIVASEEGNFYDTQKQRVLISRKLKTRSPFHCQGPYPMFESLETMYRGLHKELEIEGEKHLHSLIEESAGKIEDCVNAIREEQD